MAAVIGRGVERIVNQNSGAHGNIHSHIDYYNDRGLQSPFSLFFIVTLATNGVAILGGIVSEFDLHYTNHYGLNRCDSWLFVNACFGVLHIGIAMYIVAKIREPEKLASLPTTTYAEDGKGGIVATGYHIHSSNENDMNMKAAPDTSLTGPPDSMRRIRYILCEDKVFAAYIFVYILYFCWHLFLDIRPCNLGMAFAIRCADIFVWAAPCSFIFSVGTMMHRQGRL